MSEADHYKQYWEWLIPAISALTITPALIYLMAMPWKDQIFPDLDSGDSTILAEIQFRLIEDYDVDKVDLAPVADPVPTPSRLFLQAGNLIFCRPLSSEINRTLSVHDIHLIVVGDQQLVCHAN